MEFLLDGRPFGLARAELFDPTLGPSGGDACHGFAFHPDSALVAHSRTAALRLANADAILGDELDLSNGTDFAPSAAPGGHVAWCGGLRLSGWVRRGSAPFPPLVEAYADGARIAWARADRWRSVSRGGSETPEPGFDLALPRAFADGRAHRIELFCEGRPLPGSPVTVIAFADGLRDHLLQAAETEAEEEALRGAFFDAAFPDAVPFAAFAEWRKRFPLPPTPCQPKGPVAVVALGEDGAEETLSGPGLEIAGGWIGAALPEAGRPGRFDPADLSRFLQTDAVDCETVMFLPAGSAIHAHAADRLLGALEDDPTAAIAYGDICLAAEDGSLHPLALPAFDYERALEQGSGAFAFAMRKSAAIEAARRGLGDLLGLFLAPLDTSGPSRSVHLHVPGFAVTVPLAALPAPEVALDAVRAHLAARQVEAEVSPRLSPTLPALRIRREAGPRSLTVLLDVGDDGQAIEPALEALEPARSACELGLLVIGAFPLPEERRERLGLEGIDFLEASESASRSRRLGEGVTQAKGDLVCILDARLRSFSPDWLSELLSRMAEPDIGAVGPVILDAENHVAEAGLRLRPRGLPAPLFAGLPASDPGHGDALLVSRQAAALGDGCLLTRRADFLALGGFDPLLFPEHLGVVDYCLKLQALGRRVLLTPDATLTRSASRPKPDPAALAREEERLRARWPEVLARDPFGSPLLDRGAHPTSGLAWPPGDLSPRRPSVPPARFVPPGW